MRRRLPIIATYAYTSDSTARGSGAGTVRELLTSVFAPTDDRLWFHGRERTLDWQVEPAFADRRADLSPLYDRRVERTYTDGFNRRTLLFASEASRDESHTS